MSDYETTQRKRNIIVGLFVLIAVCALIWLIFKFGEPIREFIDKYFDWLAILFTILLIGGFVAVIRPVHFEKSLLVPDGIFMLAIILLMMVMIIRKQRLTRWQGALLVLACVLYGYFLF